MNEPKYTLEELKNMHLVEIIEMDRFSGPALIEKKVFESEQEAILFCYAHNAQNSEPVTPDYYTVANYRGKIL